MRWELKEKPVPPSFGDRRVVRKFAWFPTEVQNHIVWFEKYDCIQTFSNDRYWVTDRKIFNFYSILRPASDRFSSRFDEICYDVCERGNSPRMVGAKARAIYLKEWEVMFGKIDVSELR